MFDTFASRGIPFPLFAAPVAEASSWSANGVCVICGERRPGFALGVGDDLIVACDACGSPIAVPIEGRAEPCVSCGRSNPRDDAVKGGHGCWRCLKDGRWACTVDTAAGMVRWVDAVQGRTHGLPGGGPGLAGFPETEAEDGWWGAVIPSEMLLELVHTPNYSTWQGVDWQFHCRRPMRYLGTWGRSQFTAAAPDGDGQRLAWEAAELDQEGWDLGLADYPSYPSSVTAYMFDCPVCGTVRGHWDTT